MNKRTLAMLVAGLMIVLGVPEAAADNPSPADLVQDTVACVDVLPLLPFISSPEQAVICVASVAADFVVESAEGCLAGEPPACQTAQDAAHDCQTGADGSPCQAAHACIAGEPPLPCNPNPVPHIKIPTACESGCTNQQLTLVELGDPFAVPDFYLVECVLDLNLPVLGDVEYRFPTLNEDATCPVGDMGTGGVVPFATPDPNRPVIVEADVFQSGSCQLDAYVDLYGNQYGFSNQVPCAFPI